MNAFTLDAGLAARAVASSRLDFLGRVDVDLSVIGTWDRGLSRRTRILVPIDVQAYVATTAAPEQTLDLTGVVGDPAPFADGAPRPAGVHLHWALPDALLRATHTPGGTRPTMPLLPDAWVVVRALQPAGRQQAIATGWVVDARTGVVTLLSAYVGPADVADSPGLITPLDGARFGPVALATYTACANRFALHDPLTDLDQLKDQAPNGFTGDQAVYTVAGWWSDETIDPLHDARGPAGLDTALAGLGWYVQHDANDDDVVEPDTRTVSLASRMGLRQPQEQPAPRVYGSDGRTVTGRLTGVAQEAAYPVDTMTSVFVGDTLPTYHTLLHGSVLGVPVDGALPGADDRPAPDAVTVAIGADTDDVAAGFGTAGLGLPDDAKGLAEDALEAFVMGCSTLLGTPDGLDEFATREHTQGFWSLPGTPLPGTTPDRLRVQDTLAAGPMTVGRKGRADLAAARVAQSAGITRKGAKAAAHATKVTTLSWKSRIDLTTDGQAFVRQRIDEAVAPPDRPVDQGRTVPRPPPRYHRPTPLVLALRGAHPSHRHHGDGLFDSSGRLLCRYPRSAVPAWQGLVDGSVVLPTLGSGAIPPEVTTVVREAILLNPYADRWLAEAGAPTGPLAGQYAARLSGEMVRLYGTDGRYDGTAGITFASATPKALSPAAAKAAKGGWGALRERLSPEVQQVGVELARFSVLRGTPPSPLALTTWRQPWVPLWLEWEVTLTGSDSLRGWHLDGYDLESADGDEAPADDLTRTLHGRSPLGQGVGKQISAAVSAWLAGEGQRAVTNRTDPYSGHDVLAELGALGAPLDLVSASLDGLREQLLGLDYVGGVRRDQTTGLVVADGDPTPLFGGTLRLGRLRIVDAFGRTLDLSDAALDQTVTTVALEIEGTPRTVRLRPRLQYSARWLLRLTDAAQPPGTGPDALKEANVDELDPGSALNPVAGFLLPDHIDESLETFTVGGSPLGELGHDAITGAVTWEPAPGRAVRADAGPLEGTLPQDRLLAEVAAGLVAADAAARALPPDQRPDGSALVNLLRAVDTTLWTVDTFATVGSGTVAGLVGRPIAVVRAALRLDLPDDLDEVEVEAASGTAGRKAAFDALGDELVEVKLGTLTRSDDALLGYYVDDDYAHLHLVDKVVAANARVSGRLVGQLGLLGSGSEAAPPTSPLDHPYLVTDGVLKVRPRQTTMLTLLLLPMGKVHVTSGLLPRKEVTLADSWTAAGLKKLVPSVRVGPLLVDPAEIRLPLVSLLGDKQTFTRRTGELSWKDDPIVAATETAYLPRLPHEVQEGWIRVTPSEGES